MICFKTPLGTPELPGGAQRSSGDKVLGTDDREMRPVLPQPDRGKLSPFLLTKKTNGEGVKVTGRIAVFGRRGSGFFSRSEARR